MLKVAKTYKQPIIKKLTTEERITFLYFKGAKNPSLSAGHSNTLPSSLNKVGLGSLMKKYKMMLMISPGIPTTKNTILQDIILVSCVTRMAPIPMETKGANACCKPKLNPLRVGVDSTATVAMLAGKTAPNPIPIKPRAKNIWNKL